jgi:ribosomal 50S subunit-recycling heat shock protein
MRLDKFLKVSRLVKRRTLAKEVCDQGRVQVNGRPAKAGTNVSVGDRLTIRFGKKLLTVRVDSIAETSRKSEASEMYTIISEETLSETYPDETEELSFRL